MTRPLVADRVGEGPAVVLVHGVGLGPGTFAPVAGLLADAGRTPVVVHRPGYGRAASLADLAGARTVRIAGSGHVAQVDAARAFARLVLLACPLESLVGAR
jgi:pimeloyl-ACP methyl ester carboxylesterase